MSEINIKTEYIKLGQFLKFASLISNGGEVKMYLEEVNVYVNGEIEKRRGRKLYPDDVITIESKQYIIRRSN